MHTCPMQKTHLDLWNWLECKWTDHDNNIDPLFCVSKYGVVTVCRFALEYLKHWHVKDSVCKQRQNKLTIITAVGVNLQLNKSGENFTFIFNLCFFKFTIKCRLFVYGLHGEVLHLPMMPKMPKILGANITSMLIKVSRMTAMAMCRSQWKDLVGNNMCWMALRTCGHIHTDVRTRSHKAVLFVEHYREQINKLTGNNTIGTVNVTAVRTANRTHRIRVS